MIQDQLSQRGIRGGESTFDASSAIQEDPNSFSFPSASTKPPAPPKMPVTQATQGAPPPSQLPAGPAGYGSGPPDRRQGWEFVNGQWTRPGDVPAGASTPPGGGSQIPTMPIAPPAPPSPPPSQIPAMPIAPAPGMMQSVAPGMAGAAPLPAAGTVNQHVENTSVIDPANDLRNKVIAPGDDPVLDRARQSMSDAQQQLAGFDRGAALDSAMDRFGTGAGQRTTNLGSLVDGAAGNLANVDRVQMAMDALARSESLAERGFQHDIRTATKNNAAMGRLGSGQLRTTYGDLAMIRGQDRDRSRNEFLSDALSKSVDDQFRKTGALSDLEQRARGMFESDRDFSDRFTGNQSNDRARALEAARAVFGDVAGEAESRRGELRGERDFQVGQEQSAHDRALKQFLTEHGVEQDRFQRAMQLLGAGEAGNPGALLAGLQSSGMDPAAIAALVRSLGAGGGGSAAIQAGTGSASAGRTV